MGTGHRAWMSWSSGKDSAMALAAARQDPGVDVVGLLVAMSTAADRVAMHAVRRALVEAQADRLGLPLAAVELPSDCSYDDYERRMAGATRDALAGDVTHFVFGDLFLEDVRRSREDQFRDTGITPLFPLWGRPTHQLARSTIEAGVRAIVTCVDPRRMPSSFAGRPYDSRFLDDLPGDVDPCGERGEFHTFAFDGPGFSSAVDVEVGDVVERDGFVFCDVLPT